MPTTNCFQHPAAGSSRRPYLRVPTRKPKRPHFARSSPRPACTGRNRHGPPPHDLSASPESQWRGSWLFRSPRRGPVLSTPSQVVHAARPRPPSQHCHMGAVGLWQALRSSAQPRSGHARLLRRDRPEQGTPTCRAPRGGLGQARTRRPGSTQVPYAYAGTQGPPLSYASAYPPFPFLSSGHPFGAFLWTYGCAKRGHKGFVAWVGASRAHELHRLRHGELRGRSAGRTHPQEPPPTAYRDEADPTVSASVPDYGGAPGVWIRIPPPPCCSTVGSAPRST